jgi:hypothetical protein
VTAFHLMKCPACKQLSDIHDMAQMMARIRDAAIEIGKCPEPP